MCIICVKKKGVIPPDKELLETMFENNPHGAGYMLVRNEKVFIHKGFMKFQDLVRSLECDKITKDDVIIYHFRISTQAGVCAEMTQPFALTTLLEKTKKLDVVCDCAVAHNGIIPCTSDCSEKEYSDTALFVVHCLSKMIRSPEDLKNKITQNIVKKVIENSKLAFLDKYGNVELLGSFNEKDGLLFSNYSYIKRTQYQIEDFIGGKSYGYYKNKRYNF